ncbi:MAG: 50S ribosomal protein L3 [Thermoprotei archaeon]
MGHRKMSVPRHGSLGVRPRKRAASIVPRVRAWANHADCKLLGFPVYKVGMSHGIIVDNYPTSPTYGKEVFRALTLLEAPPVHVVALRVYGVSETGCYITLGEIRSKNTPKQLGRVLSSLKKDPPVLSDTVKEKGVKASLIVATQPWLTGLGKKTPELVEIPLGGKFSDQLSYVEKVGKEIDVSDVFSPPEFVDAVAVSRGKGYEGPVARFGIKIIQKKKAKKTKRGPGSDSPLTPSAVMSSVPRAGQMGFHNRVDYNKAIISVASDAKPYTPKAGFKHYGLPLSKLIVVEGSVPGATKRLVVLRKSVRAYKRLPKEPPKLEYVHTV